ncbi:MAG: hypothetical protein GY710_22250 [Desulfobacteraceae bacterium]|nr:hypothetical protein [Desulfobacteraceae bacterium]
MNNTISNNPVLNLGFPKPDLSQVKTQQAPGATIVSMDTGNQSGIKVNISQEGLDQNNSFISGTKVEESKTIIVTKPVQRVVITENEALDLFDSTMNLGTHKIDDLTRFLSGMEKDGSLNHGDLFSALATAGDSAGKMLEQLPEMEVEERNLFLSIAAKKDQKIVSGLVKIADLIGNTPLHLDFLKVAKNLSDDELADFIKAAIDNPEDIASLVRQTKQLGGIDRDNFLTAAADSPNLTLLISHVEGLENNRLSDFLFSAVKAGKAQGKLISLSNRLTQRQMQKDIRSMASTLSQENFENYLSASVNAGSQRDKFHSLARTLKGDKRQLFLEAAANGGSDTKAFIRQVSKMGKSSTALGNFLNAASRINDIGALISVIKKAGDGKSSFLELAKDLHTADLKNLITAAEGMKSSSLGRFIDQGNSLSGIEKSHFLFGASKAGDQSDKFMDLVENTRGQERQDLLLVLANEKKKDLPAMLNKITNMDSHEQRAQFLAQEKSDLFGSEQQTLTSTYIYLNKELDAGEFHDFLRAAGSASGQEDIELLLKLSDSVDDRSSFLKTAAGAQKELHNFLDLGEKLEDEEQENFLAVTDKLKGENLQNFLKVAGRNHENLDEFTLFTDSLTEQEKTKFLKASVDADQQGVLDKLMDLTNQLTGPSRSLFLTIAQSAKGQLSNLIKGTKNFIAAEQNSFMAQAREKGFDLMSLFKKDNTYTLGACCKNDISELVSAARATGFDPELIFSRDESGYQFRNDENREYINEYIQAIEEGDFDLKDNSYSIDGNPDMKLVGTSSGGVFNFLENAFASNSFLKLYLEPYLS